MNPVQRFWRRIVHRLIVLIILTGCLPVIGVWVQRQSWVALVAYIVLSVLDILLILHVGAALAGYASIKSRVRARTRDMRRQEEAHGRNHNNDQQS